MPPVLRDATERLSPWVIVLVTRARAAGIFIVGIAGRGASGESEQGECRETGFGSERRISNFE